MLRWYHFWPFGASSARCRTSDVFGGDLATWHRRCSALACTPPARARKQRLSAEHSAVACRPRSGAEAWRAGSSLKQSSSCLRIVLTRAKGVNVNALEAPRGPKGGWNDRALPLSLSPSCIGASWGVVGFVVLCPGLSRASTRT